METASRINFLNYITNTNFYIPLYQREFIWKKDNVRDFINDAISLFNDGEDRSLFCGTVYIRRNKENKWDVIDGQQRTTFLYGVKLALLKRIDDLIVDLEKDNSRRGKKDFEEISEISKMLKKFEVETAKGSIKKQLDAKKGSVFNIFKEIKKVFNSFFDDKSEDNLKGNIFDITNFIIFFFKKIELIQVVIKEEDDIHDIFKTINSKGKHLDDWDVIRNDIYSRSDNSEQTLNDIDNMLANLEENYFIKKEEYMQAFLTSELNELVKKKNSSESFDKFLGSLNNTQKVNKFKSELREFINKLELFDQNESKNDIPNEIKYFFKISQEMKAIQIKVIALSCILRWGIEKDIPNQLIRLLINFISYVNIHGGRANIFEKTFKSNIVDILESENNLKNIINNSDFHKRNKQIIDTEDYLNNISDSKSLIKLFVWIKPRTNNIKNSIYKKLNYEYEHVLPQTLGDWINDVKWEEINKENDLVNYVDKIGNIILLHKKLNSKVSNNIFSKKKEIYFDNKQDYYIFTNDLKLEGNTEFLKNIFDIKNIDAWTPDLIKKRTEDISCDILNVIKEKI